MKNFLFLSAIAAFAFTACQKEPASLQDSDGQTGIVDVFVTTGSPATKAYTSTGAYTISTDGERSINNLQVVFFDESGSVAKYLSNTDSKTGISIQKGSYTVYAVINGPDISSVATITDLEETTAELDTYNNLGGMLMTGSTTAVVSETRSSASITAVRMVSRISLVSVTNAAPSGAGSFTINGIMLTNVVASQNLACTSSITSWYNTYGRPAANLTSGAIIDGSTYRADAENLTWNAGGQSIACGDTYTWSTPLPFYAYPNSATGNSAFSTSYSPSYTRLVVIGTLNGRKSYYPVVLTGGLERNKAYSVRLTVTGDGTNDPQDDPNTLKGGIDVSITVQDWIDGGSYTEEI